MSFHIFAVDLFSVDRNDCTCSNPSLHGKAIRGIKNLMTSHDLDPRYVEQDAKARVAALYLPILGIVMDTIPQLHQYLPESHDRIQNIGLLEDYQGPHGE